MSASGQRVVLSGRDDRYTAYVFWDASRRGQRDAFSLTLHERGQDGTTPTIRIPLMMTQTFSPPTEEQARMKDPNAVLQLLRDAIEGRVHDAEIWGARLARACSPRSLDQARTFLHFLLSDGPMLTHDVRKAAQHAGFAWRTVERAKCLEHVKARRRRLAHTSSRNWPWEWYLDTPKRTLYEDSSKPPGINADAAGQHEETQ